MELLMKISPYCLKRLLCNSKGVKIMGKLVRETLDTLVQIIAEQIAMDKDPFVYVLAYSEIAEEHGEL